MINVRLFAGPVELGIVSLPCVPRVHDHVRYGAWYGTVCQIAFTPSGPGGLYEANVSLAKETVPPSIAKVGYIPDAQKVHDHERGRR